MVRSVNRAVSWHVTNLKTVHRIPVAAARLVPVIIPSMPVVQSNLIAHQITAQNLSHLYRARQTIMHLVQLAQRVQRHIRILMREQRLIHIAMRLRPVPVHSWHVHNHRTVHHIPVVHVHRELATGVIISLQQIHHAHRITAQNLSHLYRAKQTIMHLV